MNFLSFGSGLRFWVTLY